jgi:hypothetical protein
VRMCPVIDQYRSNRTLSTRDLPLLQLVMIDSSVNSNQHNGSTSITLDYSQLAGIHFVQSHVIKPNPYHNWRQRRRGCPGFNRVLDCVVFIALIGRIGVGPQPASRCILCLRSLEWIRKARGYAASLPYRRLWQHCQSFSLFAHRSDTHCFRTMKHSYTEIPK